MYRSLYTADSGCKVDEDCTWKDFDQILTRGSAKLSVLHNYTRLHKHRNITWLSGTKVPDMASITPGQRKAKVSQIEGKICYIMTLLFRGAVGLPRFLG